MADSRGSAYKLDASSFELWLDTIVAHMPAMSERVKSAGYD
jgi:hypothetical protein